ncbi:uncharacterized protein LY89DRAFT_685619 [Mollisia scopiformis]|uniref:Uncharacterized protein n=1 Tax=Mollisia scopiformis TaxID=149040 RepID=A0A194X667_MOLSC|nr:uncharacterized protein LY89DRAFT_685619 [Mollisia scopiformis]KUJ15670.1 hypothetical protein LY89DRAFT_685619 [Mollisia scopiformis]
MHRSTASSSNGPSTGGLFKGGSIFGGSSKTPTRPSTSSGSPSTHSESTSTLSSTTLSRSSTFSRKTSLSSTQKSPQAAYRIRNSSVASPERRIQTSASQYTDKHPLPGPAPSRQEVEQPKSADSFRQVVASAEAVRTPGSGTDSFTSTTPYANMLVRPSTGYQATGPNGLPAFAPIQPPSPTLETITYQHIQETSSKRISTLDYLRKAHEGRVYWFNTLLFNKPDLQRMPYFDSRKLARRATNYLLLGLSLPTILDLNSSTPMEFLKTLNALLSEFESFQQIHPPDGSSSLSRGRFPQMFKRATGASNKGRRQSSAAEIGLPMGSDYDSKSMNSSISSSGAGTVTSFAISETDLLPGEEYTHLLTPSLPFDPDFYETFATLCDVLIDCYTKLMSLVGSPRECNPAVAEMFTKADQRVRKIIVQGVVKEFEESSRAGVKTEVAGVGKVVLGGLM